MPRGDCGFYSQSLILFLSIYTTPVRSCFIERCNYPIRNGKILFLFQLTRVSCNHSSSNAPSLYHKKIKFKELSEQMPHRRTTIHIQTIFEPVCDTGSRTSTLLRHNLMPYSRFPVIQFNTPLRGALFSTPLRGVQFNTPLRGVLFNAARRYSF